MNKLKSVRVAPVAGRLILMPDRAFQPVPKEGARVYLDAFYTRAINKGDLTVLPDPAETTTAIAAAPAPAPVAPAAPAPAAAPAAIYPTHSS
jgi:hypothetical protein